ncbi:MAG: superoxide dismutase [Armatimonadota bacterium]
MDRNGRGRIVRREVLRGFTGCAAGIMVAELAPAEAGEAREGRLAPYPQGSGLRTETPKPLPYAEIPGFLSTAQLTPHHTAHYGGALKALLNDEQQLSKALQAEGPVASPAHSFLVKDRINRANSVVLHELYFDNMTAAPAGPREDVRTALARRFGSLERWADDFRAASMAANGWGILARDAVNGQLYNVASDLHEVGVLWFGQPLVVCDVYEHAYYVDYQNQKADYVAKFLEHLDWAEVNRRFAAV